MSHLVLSHLSKNNNCPKLVGELFTSNAGGVKIVVASGKRRQQLYAIDKISEAEARRNLSRVYQMQLFASLIRSRYISLMHIPNLLVVILST